MITNELAKTELIAIVRDLELIDKINEDDTDKLSIDAMKVGIDAIDKRIATIPQWESESSAICPSCGGTLTPTSGTKFCRYCGQAINFKERKEK
jgi:hypothetical protein